MQTMEAQGSQVVSTTLQLLQGEVAITPNIQVCIGSRSSVRIKEYRAA